MTQGQPCCLAVKVRAICAGQPDVHPLLPDVPTTGEAGGPDTSSAAARIFQQKMVDLGGVAAYQPTAAFARRIADENRKWTTVIAVAKVEQTD